MITVRNFHSTARWQRLRSRRLRIDGYVCKQCRRYGRTTTATTVHHIYPIESHWDLRFNILNLISLCNKCHEQMHNRLNDVITDVGKFWQDKIKYKLFTKPPH